GCRFASLQVGQPTPAHLCGRGQLGLSQVEPATAIPDVKAEISGVVETRRHLSRVRVRSHDMRCVRTFTSSQVLEAARYAAAARLAREVATWRAPSRCWM